MLSIFHVYSYPLSGQQTPGTNNDLKQIDFRRLSKLTNKIGHSWRSTQRPLPPSGVVHLGALFCVILPSLFKFSPLGIESEFLSALTPSDFEIECTGLSE